VSKYGRLQPAGDTSKYGDPQKATSVRIFPSRPCLSVKLRTRGTTCLAALAYCPTLLLRHRNAALCFRAHWSSLSTRAHNGTASETIVAGENLSSSLQAFDFRVDERQDVLLVHGYSLEFKVRSDWITPSTIVLAAEFGIHCLCHQLFSVVLSLACSEFVNFWSSFRSTPRLGISCIYASSFPARISSCAISRERTLQSTNR